MPKIFLLSPARMDGKRAELLLRAEARFPLAQLVRSRRGAPLGEVFSFLSGLYFRGKLTYALRFAQPPRGEPAAYVITASRGLVPPEKRVTLKVLEEFRRQAIGEGAEGYERSLHRSLVRLRKQLPRTTRVVLLGSIATRKYLALLSEVFGARLLYPEEFVGRGDMSRGALLLRAAERGEELLYRGMEQ